MKKIMEWLGIKSIPVLFTPLKDFYSKEMASHYVKGLNYALRSKDETGLHPLEKAGRERLAGLLPRWVKDGLVRYGTVDDLPGGGSRRVGGVGLVE